MYLNPNEEANLRFYRLEATAAAKIFTIICSIVIIITMCTAPHDYTKFTMDNYPNATHTFYLENPVPRRHIVSYVKEQEANQDSQNQSFNFQLYLRDNHYKSLGMKRISYGYTFDTYCWDDAPPPSDWSYIPSLLRLFEFRPLVASGVRFAVLFTMAPRIILSYFRSSRIRILSTSTNIFVSKIVHFNYWVVALQCTAEFWVCALHQDCDRNYKYLMPYTIVLLAVTSALNMLLVIIEDIYDTTLRLTQCVRFYIRVFCLLVVILLFPTVIDNYLLFLERKLCHPYVHWSVALPEYLIAMALATFILTESFDMPNIYGYITCCVGEVSSEFYHGDYVPAVKFEEERLKPRICKSEDK